jgi:hypothetical protein
MLKTIILGWLFLYAFRKLATAFECGKNVEDYCSRKLGLTFSIFHVVCETNYFNSLMFETFNEPDTAKRKFLGQWWNCGVVVMFCGQIISVLALTILLLYSINKMFFQAALSDGDGGTSSNINTADHAALITPILPGVNFPAKFIFDFWVCTFVVIVVHEFGHAAAASMERLQIQGCGTFFLFMFPGNRKERR